MKILGVLIFALLTSMGLLYIGNGNRNIDFNNTEAIYIGINTDGGFEFEDNIGNIIVFQELNNFSMHDLYEEIYMGRSFEILWEERNLLSDENYSSYEVNKIKKIIRLKLLDLEP